MSHFKVLAAKSETITSALLRDLLIFPFETVILGLTDLYEQVLSSILTRLQRLLGLLEATGDKSCKPND